jgi:hypothetical protein
VNPVPIDSPEHILIKRPAPGAFGTSKPSTPRSRHSKITGDRAEEVIYRWLRANLPEEERESVDWIAQRGEKPGWDIQYISNNGNKIAVEVKGTSLGSFSVIELTSNEWEAAKLYREKYLLYLVASCHGTTPRIVRISDPFGKYKKGIFYVEPTGWRLFQQKEIET